MYQVMQSVKVKNDKLAQFGHAGYVVEDNTQLVSGVWVGNLDVRMDSDSDTYVFDCNDVEGL